jgi:hypothetical protein
MVLLAPIQAVEVGDAINAGQHGFTVDYKLLGLDPACSLNDQRVTDGPVISVVGEQADTITVALTIKRNPSCLISCIQSGRDGTAVPRVGLQGA